MELRENEPLKSKTTMRIGGTAKYYAELVTRRDAEEAIAFADKTNIPLIMIAAGSNTIFADDVINALVVRITADKVNVKGNTVSAEAGKNLAMLINELAEQDLDLSPLTGIPGTVGGALVGNAGQGPNSVWTDTYVIDVTAYVDGEWKTFSKKECQYAYRESVFKYLEGAPIVWDGTLTVPSAPASKIKAEVERLLMKRIETQPHIRTAGSCFKAHEGTTPAWRLVEKEGLRGHTIGGVQISEKHANFLLNTGDATFNDAAAMVDLVRSKIPGLEVEMRFVQADGTLRF